MNKFYCDNCGSRETYVKDFEDEYPVKGLMIKITSKNRFCKRCDCHVYDSELDNMTLRKVFKKYTELVGVPPEEVIALRKSYNLSQEQFAKIIGCAKKTLVSYENGNSIPNDIYLVILKTLMDNPDVIKYLIDSNMERYTDEEYNKIQRRLRIVEKETDDYTPFNGYTEYSYDRLLEMITLLSKKSILKTKLLKEMFYCDYLCYKNGAYNITGLEYSKLNYGPVPNNFEEILEQLIEDGVITETVKYKGDYECHIIKSNDNIKITHLLPKEIELIKKVSEYFKDFTVKEIVDYSHKEKAFIETEYYKSIDYTYALDIEDFTADK